MRGGCPEPGYDAVLLLSGVDLGRLVAEQCDRPLPTGHLPIRTHPKDSSRRNHASNLAHSLRIVSSPISTASTGP